MSHTFRSLAFLVCVLLLAADKKADPEPAKPTPPKADVRGEVKRVNALNARDVIGNILVIGTKEKDTQHDRASVRLTKETKFFKWVDGKKKEARFADIQVGARVQCLFTGPVAESYPVQARASEVLILQEAKN